MKKHLKYIGFGFLIGIGITIVLSIISKTTNIDLDHLTNVVLVIATLVVLFTLIYNYLYTRKYRKRVMYQLELLNKHEPELALKDMQDLYQLLIKKHSKYYVNIVKLNMSAAYCDMKQYAEALALLLELSETELSGQCDFIYRLNLCACYFYLGKKKEALYCYTLNKRIFDKYHNHKLYGGNVAVVEIFALLAEKEYKQAEKLYQETKSKWNNPRLEDDYANIENFIKNNYF